MLLEASQLTICMQWILDIEYSIYLCNLKIVSFYVYTFIEFLIDFNCNHMNEDILMLDQMRSRYQFLKLGFNQHFHIIFTSFSFQYQSFVYWQMIMNISTYQLNFLVVYRTVSQSNDYYIVCRKKTEKLI